MSTTATSGQETVVSSQPAEKILQAIQEADYAKNGAPFAPLLLKFTAASQLHNGWNSEKGDTQISFYSFPAPADSTDQFLPLGDFATINNADPGRAAVMLVAPIPGQLAIDGQPLLKHPTGFEWILDDKHSGNDNNIAYFWPTAPDGYEAVGVCFGFNGATPEAANYWCVHKQVLQKASLSGFWGDAGQGWKSHNGDLNVPDLTNQSMGNVDTLLLAPTTFLSVEKGGDLGRGLVLGKLFLDAKIPVADPVYYDDCQEGDKTVPGLAPAAVLPCTVVTDPNENSSPLTDPFYYLASEPYWDCFQRLPSEKATHWSRQVSVGTTTTDSNTFQRTSSLTVGAETGVEAEGLSAKVSVSFTDEMQVSVYHADEKSSLQVTTADIDLPTAKMVFVWLERTNIVLYRTEGSPDTGAEVANAVLFEKASVACTHSPS
ncbi:hypothetical protein Achl_4479 (plasmid) [Pseudarthrobacter chlorophenolicus A6]|uniref:Uncharacterized protein n=1 Tax=Pseudarthrobacter chlorophenolicus (strain ATCC 700700 / DSM 12829 / CIP 107037 / JCM 12360 / KCTC 9906 / NCIMB 13794 / A6) TaxID=452863 RepID=B8HJ33_PSECP|nr:Vps62-related protein [Pseudarthrobacter chlorophenolicus]ACL42430.1 hypothetical protein Achl_4479 [Pseudarthrobacter chlorophenolicus A6]SDQ18032.1 protein of unknown function [Pseudarthrobacter chlorophenolicus]